MSVGPGPNAAGGMSTAMFVMSDMGPVCTPSPPPVATSGTSQKVLVEHDSSHVYGGLSIYSPDSGVTLVSNCSVAPTFFQTGAGPWTYQTPGGACTLCQGGFAANVSSGTATSSAATVQIIVT